MIIPITDRSHFGYIGFFSHLSLQPLLQMQPAQSKVVLAVSALAHSYCLVDTNCGETREVQEMVRRPTFVILLLSSIPLLSLPKAKKINVKCSSRNIC